MTRQCYYRNSTSHYHVSLKYLEFLTNVRVNLPNNYFDYGSLYPLIEYCKLVISTTLFIRPVPRQSNFKSL